jgi:hypothetical protein
MSRRLRSWCCRIALVLGLLSLLPAAPSFAAPEIQEQAPPNLSFYLTSNDEANVYLRVTDPNGDIIDIEHQHTSTNTYAIQRCWEGPPQYEQIAWNQGLSIAGNYTIEVYTMPGSEPPCNAGSGNYDLVIHEAGIAKQIESGNDGDPQIAPNIIKRFTYSYSVPVFPATGDWQELISFRPSLAMQGSLESQNMSTQHIEENDFSRLNTDYLGLTIKLLPIKPNAGRNQRFTEAEFFEYVRTHLTDFAPQFQPYSPGSGSWATAPLGFVWRIDLPNAPDWGDVVTALYSNSENNRRWRFTTITTDLDGSHPVTGNRDFGLVNNNKVDFTFYTRGADRNNRIAIPDDVVFWQGELFWRTVLGNLATFVNTNGGITGDLSVTRMTTPWFNACFFHWQPSEFWQDDSVLRRWEFCQP